MSKPLVIHVDYGSRGNSGLYILSTLDYLNIDAEVKGYVSSSFDYQSNKKTIKIFDNISNKVSIRIIQKVVRYFELFFSLIFISVPFFFTKRPVYLFVSLYEPFLVYKWFFQLCKVNRNVRITSIIHDADSLYNNYPRFIMCKQDEIIKQADYILVHTAESATKLQKCNKPIWRVPFPVMPLGKPEQLNYTLNNGISFLFIGYLRKEKGVEILVEAWREIQNEFNNISLTIAGAIPFNLEYNFTELKNCTLILDFLDDSQYANLIEKCTYVILPYTSGTNSGVLSTVASLNKPSIVSDIPMFKESMFCIPELMFNSASIKSLTYKLKQVINEHDHKYKSLVSKIKQSNEVVKNEFIAQLNTVHSAIMNHEAMKY